MAAARDKTSGVHLWLVLSRASKAVQAHDLRSIQSLGLGLTEFAVLEALLHLGPLPVGSLGRRVLLTSGSMTAAIDRLAERGLVERHDDPKDRRARVIDLTPKGRALIVRAFARHAKTLEGATSSLTKSEKATLIGLLKKLGKDAQAKFDQPGPEIHDP